MDDKLFFGDTMTAPRDLGPTPHLTEVELEGVGRAVKEKDFGAIAEAQYQESLEVIAQVFRDDPKLIALAQVDLPIREAYRRIGINIPPIPEEFLVR
jgi:hypothetical protein